VFEAWTKPELFRRGAEVDGHVPAFL
jgi:hypothetical protein